MSKGVFLCVGTGGHVLPAYNVIKSISTVMDKPRKHIPKDANNWLYCILNGIK